jgi:type IV pilus assembly protein PilW
VQSMNSIRRAEQGFSLVELMVGVVIAMAAVVVVMQVFQVSEGSRRTTGGSDDAQTVGAIALTSLQRDLRQAGDGLSNLNMLACTLTLSAGKSVTNLAPVTINHADIPAGDAGTDTLLIVYSNGRSSPEGVPINTVSGAVYNVTVGGSFRRDDRVIATPQTRAAPCLLTMTSVTGAPTGSDLPLSAGSPTDANGTLYNWGEAPRVTAFAVRNGRLTHCDFMTQDCRSAAAANWSEIADGIVSLRAEYGRDLTVPRDASVDTYDQTTPTSACGLSRITALRLVLVARSGQMEKADLAIPAPTWAAGASAPITLTGDWKRYRYKTFETTVPLRNVPAQGVDGQMDTTC